MICFGQLKAQNSLFLSHQMLVPSSFNPGALGAESVSNLIFVYRNQWTGYSPNFYSNGGAPNTQMLCFNVPIQGIPLTGFGLNISNDNLGAENNFQIHFQTAFQIRLNFASLYLGVTSGLYSKVLRGNELNFNDPEDPLKSEITQSQLKPDFGFGAWYVSNQGYYLGLSTLNTLEPNFDFGYGKIERSYTLSAGTQYKLTPDFILRPNLNVRSDLSEVTFDVGSMVYYQTKLWTGVSYRLEESLMAFVGYGLLQNQLKVGYAFEYIVHNRAAKNSTSHEILIKYLLPELVFGGRKSVKTPRFSF